MKKFNKNFQLRASEMCRFSAYVSFMNFYFLYLWDCQALSAFNGHVFCLFVF